MGRTGAFQGESGNASTRRAYFKTSTINLKSNVGSRKLCRAIFIRSYCDRKNRLPDGFTKFFFISAAWAETLYSFDFHRACCHLRRSGHRRNIRGAAENRCFWDADRGSGRCLWGDRRDVHFLCVRVCVCGWLVWRLVWVRGCVCVWGGLFRFELNFHLNSYLDMDPIHGLLSISALRKVSALRRFNRQANDRKRQSRDGRRFIFRETLYKSLYKCNGSVIRNQLD